MRLLIVGMLDSMHVARWLATIDGQGWDVHLFGERDTLAHPRLAGATLWQIDPANTSRPAADLLVRPALGKSERATRAAMRRPARRAAVLAGLIRRLRPDVVHSMEFQHAGYLTLDARSRLGPGRFPPWIASNFGSDIHLFGRFPEHQPRIRDLLAAADVHHCECARDLAHGRRFGFAGRDAALVPMGGGWDLDAAAVHRTIGPVSARRTIALKAYEGWAGRAGVALEALRRVVPLLDGYTLAIYLASTEMQARSRLVAQETGMRLEVVSGLPGFVPYEQILSMHGRSRISIGLSISDAISTSLLEAMVMGSFPIQSGTGCGGEWIEDGVSGILVHPEDPQPVANAIRRVLTDDALVDRAAAINAATVRARLDYPVVRSRIVDLYQDALARGRNRGERGGVMSATVPPGDVRVGPVRFAIVSVGRSGSTMLQHLLDSHPEVRCHGEEITKHPGVWSTQFGNLSMEQFLRDVRFAGPFRAIGIKAMIEHALDFPETWDVLQRLGCRLIVNTRRNKLNQYISMKLAMATVDWSSRASYPETRIRLDPEDFIAHAREWVLLEAQTAAMLDRFPTMTVSYEAVLRGEGIDEMQRFIGVEPQTLRTETVKARWQRREDVVENWDEIVSVLSRTRWAPCLDGEA